MKTIFKFLLLLFLTGCTGITGTADLVLIGGKVYTLDSENSIVQALAMKDGKILAVGSDEEISSYIGENSSVIDLEGKTVTPGLVESHGHLFYTGSSLLTIDLSGVANYEELVAKVKESVENTIWFKKRRNCRMGSVLLPINDGWQGQGFILPLRIR